MTESEFFRLPITVREKLPVEDLIRLHLGFLLTLEEMAESLTIEGWEHVGEDARFVDDPEDRPSHIWRREINGVVEWCNVFWWPFSLEEELEVGLEADPDRGWAKSFHSIDPRTTED